MSTGAGQAMMVLALALLVWLAVLAIRRGGALALLGWSLVAAAVYIGVASPVGRTIWSTIDGWSVQATAWLDRMKGVTA